MGLAPLLVDTYHTNKNGTSNFVQWPAETARATGTVNNIFKDNHQEAMPPSGGRLKGAAGKEANKAELSQITTTTYQIPAKSFLTLATAIARDARAYVPHSVFTILRAVIRGRKDCAVWYAMTSDREDDAAKGNNASHKHFIKVLEDVWEIIKVKRPRSKHQPPKAAKQGPVPTANMYELLEDEELVAGEEMPDVIENPVRIATEKVSYKLEPADADVSFAIYCFLKDATYLRLAVRRTWREFAKGDIKLQAAAQTMNAALPMIEALSDEFEQANPQFKDTKTKNMHGLIINFIYRGYRKNGEGSAFIDVGDEESDPRHTQSGFRLSSDEERFLKCVSQLEAIPEGQRYIGSYMVHKATSLMLCQGRLNSWIVFSLQIFWDMQRELGPLYLDVKGLEDVGDTHKLHRHGMMQRKLYVDASANKAQMQQMFDEFEQQASWKLASMSDFAILKCDPALCCLFMAGIRDEYHRTAIDMASNQGHILVAAHLYNAVKSTGNLPGDLKWTDMEWLIEQQNSDWMFVGKRPEHGYDFRKRVNIVMGFSAYKFTENYKSRKPDKQVETKFGAARRFEYHARYAELSVDREPRVTGQGLSSLEKLRIFKLAIGKDEQALAFDVIEFYLRCLHILQEIQRYANVVAPLDYSDSRFTRGLPMKSVVSEMLWDLNGHPRLQPSIFPVAATILRKAIQKEGDTTLTKARIWQEKMKLKVEDFKAMDEPSFENPDADRIGLHLRKKFGTITCMDGKGNFTSPFGTK
ncbi:hypothetical protein J4E91_009347 [Alternaria rosae]|nr:hypothetical protein J4E91_009347 [Alternaria rosae]